MSKGTENFQKERLTQAKDARGFTAVRLSELTDINDVSISKYERGHALPPLERLQKIADVLRLPLNYFLKPLPEIDVQPVFWRSLHVSAKTARTRALGKFGWTKDIADYLASFLDFPKVNLPHINPPADFSRITADYIEGVAREYRQEWQVERGPLPNVIRLLEKNGVVIAKSMLEADNLDAFSQVRNDGRPFMFLGSDKKSAARSRFDALHELGHLLLHPNVEAKTLNAPQNWKAIESQAHRFAAAMLLPAEEFLSDLTTPSLDSFRAKNPSGKLRLAQ